MGNTVIHFRGQIMQFFKVLGIFVQVERDLDILKHISHLLFPKEDIEKIKKVSGEHAA